MEFDLEQTLKNLPELIAGKGLWQNKFHEYDVYEHTMKYAGFVKEMTSDDEMIVAGYLHDIAKPVVKKPKMKDGRLEEKEAGVPYHEFDDHEKVGEQMVRKMPAELFAKYSLNQDRIAKLVGAHYLPMEYIKRMRKSTDYISFTKIYNDLEQALDSASLERSEVMTMFLADCLAKGKGCTDIDELKLARDTIINNGDEDHLKRLYDLQKSVYGNKE